MHSCKASESGFEPASDAKLLLGGRELGLITRLSYQGTSCTCGDGLGDTRYLLGLCQLAWAGDKLEVAPKLCGGFLTPSFLLCPCPKGGRKRRRGGSPWGGRAGPEREFEKRKEVGPGRTPSHPLAASPQDDARCLQPPPAPTPHGQAMAPWRKTDKERHGVGRCGHGVLSREKGRWPKNRIGRGWGASGADVGSEH